MPKIMTSPKEDVQLEQHNTNGDIAATSGNIFGGDVLLVCEHAANFLPPELGDLGLDDASREAHIAWDIGALALSRDISSRLDCGLVYANVSRLVVDLNRKTSAKDVIPSVSETTQIPGNKGLSSSETAARLATYHTPFHQILSDVLDERARQNLTTHLVSIHSFTANYRGKDRPWHAGIIYNHDAHFANQLIAQLRQKTDLEGPNFGATNLEIGENQPYSPADGVFHTLETHGTARGLPTAMVEIRNDLLRQPTQIASWGSLLQRAISSAVTHCSPNSAITQNRSRKRTG